MQKKRMKLIIIITIVVLIFLYVKFFKNFKAEDIRNYVNSFGMLSPLIYILIFMFIPMVFFPVPVLALAGGLAFGLWQGTIYTIIGAVLNSAIMFFMAKFLARDLIVDYLLKKIDKKWFRDITNGESKNGFMLVFILRLIPFVPYNLVNYGMGLTSINFKKYMLATIIGILPGTLVFLNIGDKAINIHNPAFILSIALLIVLIIASISLSRVISSKKLKKSEE